jgi:hypothetical protein
MMTPKQKAVLSELDWLSQYAGGSDKYWRPYHVRYFRTTNYPREADMTMLACTFHLKNVHLAGWADKGKTGGLVGYRINDAGRKALADE